MLKPALFLCICLPIIASDSASWHPDKAAQYLDQRQAWWESWPAAARDHSTVCISCHTAMPYMLARRALHGVLRDGPQSQPERNLLESVKVRVDLWSSISPYYTDSSGTDKRLQSLGTEAVLNALVLLEADSDDGRMSARATSAFAHMWDLQQKSGDARGSWAWLNFGNEPFEARESGFFGAALAAAAVSFAPEDYRKKPDIDTHVKLLGEYMRREIRAQPLINQLAALWASTRLPGVLSAVQQKAIAVAVIDSQRTDGGWSTASMCCNWPKSSLRSTFKLWFQSDVAVSGLKSDGYATGLAFLALSGTMLPSSDTRLMRARSWLIRNQDPVRGTWPGYSLNAHTDLSSETGSFMTDAATAWAALALTTESRH